jgi:hypothetical protein
MRIGRRAVLVVALALAGAAGCGAEPSVLADDDIGEQSSAITTSMLWNPGPNRRAGIHANNSDGGACQVTAISDMSGGNLDGNPAGACSTLTCNGSPWTAPDNSCPSYYHVTYGWDTSFYGAYPGWAVWYMSGGYGTPANLRLHNNASGASGTCDLREVSTTYTSFPWNTTGYWAFKSQYVTTAYTALYGNFKGTLVSAAAPGCTTTPSSYVTSDLVVKHFNSSHSLLRTDVVGVLVYNNNGYDMNGNPNDNIFYSNGCSQSSSLCQVLLHGNKLGYADMTTGGATYSINYKPLLSTYLPPAPTGTTDSVIATWEVYSATRGGNIVFDLTNLDFQGTN